MEAFPHFPKILVLLKSYEGIRLEQNEGEMGDDAEYTHSGFISSKFRSHSDKIVKNFLGG